MTGQCQCGCAGFTRSEEYVWYYHSGRGTVRLFRRHDAAMVANYALAAEATALVSTSWSLVAGDREGGLTMLAITDPAAGQQAAAQLLASLPSRQRGNTEPVNGGLMRSPLARYCTVLYYIVLCCTALYCTALHCTGQVPRRGPHGAADGQAGGLSRHQEAGAEEETEEGRNIGAFV